MPDMASVTPRRLSNGDVKWRVQFRIGQHMCQETFAAEKDARDFGRLVDRVGGAAARSTLQARQTKDAGVPTLSEFTARYLDINSGLLTGIEPGTRAEYVRVADRSFLPLLGDLPVDAITKADVGRWVAWQETQSSAARKGQKISAKTVRNYHAILSSVMSSAMDEGYRSDNPAYRTRLSKGVKREAVFLSAAEFATLLHFIPSPYDGLVMFLAGTGCRWGESTAVTWGDLNTSVTPATIRIDKAWKKSENGAPVLKHPKSSRSRRTVSLTSDVVSMLGNPGDPASLIFSGVRSGGHIWYGRFRASTWLPAVAKAMDREQCAEDGLVPLRAAPNIHDLRHSHASWLIADGVPLTFVQARLGHESIQTTSNVYGHLQPDAHIQMSDTISRTLANVRPIRAVE